MTTATPEPTTSRYETTTSRAQQLKTTVSALVEDLADELEQGDTSRLSTFLQTMAKFHGYSFGNIILITTQRPDASRVAGYTTWKSMGRSVKKGEKGIAIIAPMMIKARKREMRSTASDDEPASFLRFKVAHVFDLSQTEGEPLPELARASGDPAESLEQLESAIRRRSIELVVADHLGGAQGISSGGCITVLARLSPAEHFSVLAHELAHELLHKVENRPPMVVREAEAEAVAHVVSSVIGLETRQAATDYIRLYQGTAETLAKSLDRIQRTAATILEGIEQVALDKQAVCAQYPVTPQMRAAVSGRSSR